MQRPSWLPIEAHRFYTSPLHSFRHPDLRTARPLSDREIFYLRGVYGRDVDYGRVVLMLAKEPMVMRGAEGEGVGVVDAYFLPPSSLDERIRNPGLDRDFIVFGPESARRVPHAPRSMYPGLSGASQASWVLTDEGMDTLAHEMSHVLRWQKDVVDGYRGLVSRLQAMSDSGRRRAVRRLEERLAVLSFEAPARIEALTALKKIRDHDAGGSADAHAPYDWHAQLSLPWREWSEEAQSNALADYLRAKKHIEKLRGVDLDRAGEVDRKRIEAELSRSGLVVLMLERVWMKSPEARRDLQSLREGAEERGGSSLSQASTRSSRRGRGQAPSFGSSSLVEAVFTGVREALWGGRR